VRGVIANQLLCERKLVQGARDYRGPGAWADSTLRGSKIGIFGATFMVF
jgi:hypothetical protein